MAYCLDADVFIQAHRLYYSFDIAPSFWNALVTHAQQGLTYSPLAVFEEIIAGEKDELSKWTKKHKELIFREPTPAVNESYTEIANYVTINYEIHQVNLFLNGADPWVIAHAMVHVDNVVVTQETLKNEQRNANTSRIEGKIKIPNICRHFGVKWINTFTLLRELRIRL